MTACLLALVQLAPIVRTLWQGRVDFLTFVLGAQFVGYTASILLKIILSGGRYAPDGAETSQLWELIGCTLLLLFSFEAAKRWLRVPSLPRGRQSPVRLDGGGVLLLGGLVLLSFLISRYIPQESTDLLIQAELLICTLVICARVSGWLEALVVALAGYSFLYSANLGFFINLVVLWSVLMFIERRLEFLARLAVVLLPMIFLQEIKADYRAWIGAQGEPGLATRLENCISLFKVHYRHAAPPDSLVSARSRSPEYSREVDSLVDRQPDFDHTLLSRGLHASLNRLGDDSLKRVLRGTPVPVPFWQGRSYLNFVYLLIPLKAWRPSDWNIWNEYGRKYSILHPDDRTTEVVFSYFAEGYMNFGRVGLYLCAILVGVLIAGVQRLAVWPESDLHAFAFICFLLPLLGYQGDLSSLLVKLLWTGILLLLARPLLRKRSLAPSGW